MNSKLARVALFVGCNALAFAAAAQPSGSPRGRAQAATPVTITMPDTMKVSVREPVPVNARLGDAVTARLAEPPPWWDSNVFASLLGALIGGLLVIVGQAAERKLARGRLHRNSLVRLERACQDYLNEIISNKRLAGDTRRAAEKTAVFWHLPNPFEIDTGPAC